MPQPSSIGPTRPWQSISLRLPLLLITAITAVALIAIYVSSLIITNRTEQLVRSNLEAIADSTGEQINRELRTKIRLLEAVASDPQLKIVLAAENNLLSREPDLLNELDRRDEVWRTAVHTEPFPRDVTLVRQTELSIASEIARTYAGNDPNARNGFIILNRYGTLAGASYRPRRYNYFNTPWRQQIHRNPDSLYINFRDIETDTPAVSIMAMAMPILDSEDEIIGYVYGAFDFTPLKEVINSSRFGLFGRVVLINENGRILYTVPQNQTLHPYRIPLASDNRQLNNLQDETGGEYVYTTRPLQLPEEMSGLDLYLAALRPADEALAPVDSARWQTAGLMLLIALLTTGMFYFGYVHPLTADIGRLRRGAVNLRQNPTDAPPIELNRRDELGTLASAFNQMAVQVRREIDQRETLIQTRLRLREQRVLLDLTSRLTQTLDTGQIYRHTTQIFADQFQSPRTTLARWQPEQEAMVTLVEYVQSANEPSINGHHTRYEMHHLDQHPITQKMIKTQQPVMHQVNDPDLTDSERQRLLRGGHTISLELPLIAGGEMLGMLTLYRNDAGATFGEPEIVLGRAMAVQTALALQNALFATQAHARVSQLSTLNRLNRQLAAAIKLQDVYHVTRQELLQLLPATGLHIFLLEDERLRKVYGYDYGLELRTDHLTPQPLDRDPLSAYIIESSEPLIIQANTMHTVPDHLQTTTAAVQGSWIGVPLTGGRQMMGVLVIENIDSSEGFSPTDVTSLLSAASTLTITIQNQHLLRRTQETLAETSRQYLAGRELIQAANRRAVYQTLVNFAAETELFDEIRIVTPATHTHRTMFPVRWMAPHLRERITAPEPDIKPPVSLLLDNRMRAIRLTADDPGLDPATRTLYDHYGLRSGMLIPIHLNDRWFASLVLNRLTDKLPERSELQSIQALSRQAAVILANQDLLRETSALYSLSRALSEAITRDDVAQLTMREIVAYTSAPHCQILQFDHQDGRLKIMASTETNISTRPTPLWTEHPLYHHFQQTRRPWAVTDAAAADEGQQAMIKTYLQPHNLKAALFVPALSQGELTAVLAVGAYTANWPITTAMENFVRVAAKQFTTTLENMQLFDEALLRAQELITINQVGARISSTLDPDKLVQILAQEERALFDSQFLLLARYQQDGRHVQPLTARLEEETLKLNERRLAEDDPLTVALRGAEGMVADARNPLTAAVSAWRPSTDAPAPAATVVMPLRQEDRTVGFIALQSAVPNAYTAEKTQLLRAIANQTALSLSNATLWQQTQASIAELRTLFDVTQSMASSVDAEKRIDNAIDTLQEILPAATITVYVYDKSREALRIIAHTNTDHAPPAPGSDWRETILGNAIRYNTPLFVEDLQELPPPMTKLSGHNRSQIAVPLTISQQTIGVLTVQHPQPNAFSERDLRLLQTLSISLAATIESGRLFQQIQDANERLRELDKMKTQFLANMSHELRTPLNSIIGFSRLILKGIDGPINDVQEQDLSSIYNSGQHLLNLINDILDLAKMDAGKMALVFQTVDIVELAASVHATARGLISDHRRVKLIWNVPDDLPQIEADPVRLRQILLNLLSNAAKFTEEGAITLTITAEEGLGLNGHKAQEIDGILHLTVTDTGIGIDQSHFDRLFAKFEQIDNSPSRTAEGTGLGLPIVHELVHLHHGRIWVESEVGTGSTFHIQLPLRQPQTAPPANEKETSPPSESTQKTGEKPN